MHSPSLLRKILAEVTLDLQQLNREALPAMAEHRFDARFSSPQSAMNKGGFTEPQTQAIEVNRRYP